MLITKVVFDLCFYKHKLEAVKCVCGSSRLKKDFCSTCSRPRTASCCKPCCRKLCQMATPPDRSSLQACTVYKPARCPENLDFEDDAQPLGIAQSSSQWPSRCWNGRTLLVSSFAAWSEEQRLRRSCLQQGTAVLLAWVPAWPSVGSPTFLRCCLEKRKKNFLKP